jgi:alpha-D-ribose 1-methylphosphonate 5-triphosphate synthase subunit PhnH
MMTVAPGFADPPLAAQAVFRRLLDAMARPGTVAPLEAPPAPSPLAPAAGAIALTLCDADTQLWLCPALREPAVVGWLRFHTGCRIVEVPEEAAFAFAADPSALPPDRLSTGSDEFPDRSATAVLQVAQLGAGDPLHLTGPGIETTTTLRVEGLPAGFIAWRGRNHVAYPRGVDVVLVAGAEIAALPRSTTVTEG